MIGKYFKTDPKLWGKLKTKCKKDGLKIGYIINKLIKDWVNG
jgi:hypothetical protein